MRILIEEYCVPRFSVCSDGNLIGHRAFDHVYGILFTEQSGRVLFEHPYCRVVAIDVIADHSVCHSAPHRLCRAAASIAAKINHDEMPSLSILQRRLA